MPFLFSAVLLIVALYVRLSIDETPVFAREQVAGGVPKAPFTELFRTQSRQVALPAGCMVGIFTMSFLGGTYLMSYASTRIGHPRSLILGVGVLAGVALMVFSAISALLCDRYGRRRWAVGLMIAFFVVVSIVCTALLPETKGAALERDAAVAC